MNVNIIVIFLISGVLVFCSCGRNKTEELWAEEEAKLAEWISENKPHLVMINNGIYFERIGDEYVDNLKPDSVLRDNVLLDFECRLLEDGTVEEVSYREWWEYGAKSPSTYREGGPELWHYERWVKMGIGRLRENERANIYVPSRLLDLVDFQTRVFTVHLKKVVNPDIKAYQETLMGNFMEQFGTAVDTITVLDNGKDYHIMYYIADEGWGEEISATTSEVSTKTSEFYFMEDDDFRNGFRNKATTGFNDDKSRFSTYISRIFDNNPEKNNKPVRNRGKIIAVMPYRIMYGTELITDVDVYGHEQYVAPVESVLMYEIQIDN